MDNIIDFEKARAAAPIINFDDDVILRVNRHTPEFTTAAHAVGDYLVELPLSNAQHNKLVKLLVNQIDVAECGGFLKGFELGLLTAREYYEGNL